MKRPWRSGFYLVTALLVAVEFVSGWTSFFAPGNPIYAQAVFIAHTVLGLAAGVLVTAYYAAHWQETKHWKSQPITRWSGHASGILLALSIVGALPLFFTGSFGRGAILYWAHAVAGTVGAAAMVYHVAFSYSKSRAKVAAGKGTAQDLKMIRVRSAAIAWISVGMVAGLAAAGTRLRGASPYVPVPAAFALPFGPSPFAPNEVQTPGFQFVRAEVLESSKGCGQSGCHMEIYKEWSESSHRYAADNPFFRKTLAYMAQTAGHPTTRYCGGCHAPNELLTGTLDANAEVQPQNPGEGIGCVACHSVTFELPPSGTGAFTLIAPEPYLFSRAEGGWQAWVGQELIRLRPAPHRQAFMRKGIRSSEFCASCHKQSIDGATNHYRWSRLQDQYDDWQESGFSGASAFARFPEKQTKDCNACHMRPEATADPAATNGKTHSHRYIAADTALPFYYGNPEQLQRTVKWLKRDEVEIDIFAVRAIDGQPVFLAPLNRDARLPVTAQSFDFDIVIKNKIAHRMPTGPLDIFEAWLAVTVKDRCGNGIFESGELNAAGYLSQNAHQLYSPPVGQFSKWVRRHDLWNLHAKTFNLSLAAQASDVVHYSLKLPAKSCPPFTVSAALRYRRFNRWFTEFILGENAPPYPIVDMDTDEVTLNAGNSVPVFMAEDRPRFVRYARALLKQQRYGDAQQALEKGIDWKAPNPDALLDLAETFLGQGTLGTFQRAAELIRTAHRNAPDHARARALFGVVLQQEGDLEHAGEVFANLQRSYPKDRQVQNALAWTRHLQGRYQEAIRALNLSLGIDQHQAEVYHRLSLAYGKLGDAVREKENFALFQKYRNDPASLRSHEDFLKENPWAAREAELFHTHARED